MSEKIRLAIVNEGTAGGIRKRIFHVLRHIDRESFDVTVLLSGNRKGYTAEKEPFPELNRMGIPYVTVPMVRAISPLRDFRSLLRLRREMQNGRFDLVHAHSAKAGYLCRVLRRMRVARKCIYSPHVFAFQRTRGPGALLYESLERTAINWADAMIVDSTGEKEQSIRLRFRDPDRIHVLPDAVELPEGDVHLSRKRVRDELGVPDSSVVFVTASRLVAYKGHETLMGAFARVVQEVSGVELWIAGGGEARPTLESLCVKLHVAKVVRFLGHRNDMYDVLAASDCAVLASQAEGSPHFILEALAMEKPVLASEVQGNVDLLTSPENCRLLPWNNIGEWAGAMIDFARTPFPGAPRHVFSSTWFDIPGQIRKLETIYRHVLDEA